MSYNYSQKLHNSCCNYCRFIDPYDEGIDGEMQSIFRCYCKATHSYMQITSSSNCGCGMFVYSPLSNAYGFDESESVDDFKRGLDARKQLRREVMIETLKRFDDLNTKEDSYTLLNDNC